MSIDPRDASLSTFALEIGFPLLLGAALALYMAVTSQKMQKEGKLALGFTAAGAFFALAATTLFPWSYVRVLTMGLSDYLQFPWRMLMMTAVLLAFAGGWAYMAFAGEKEKTVILVIALCVMAALPTISDETRNNVFIPYGETASPDLAYVEYTIPGTKTRPTNDQSIKIEGDAVFTQYHKEGTRITAHVSAGQDSAAALPLFGYDGYTAKLDGKEIAWRLGENNRLTVDIPAGTDAQLTVCYAGKTVFRVADCISLLCAAALAAYAVMKKRLKGEQRPNQEK